MESSSLIGCPRCSHKARALEKKAFWWKLRSFWLCFSPEIFFKVYLLNRHPNRWPDNEIAARLSRYGHHSLHLIKVLVSSFELPIPCDASFAEERLQSHRSRNQIWTFLQLRRDTWSLQCRLRSQGCQPSHLDCKLDLDSRYQSPDRGLWWMLHNIHLIANMYSKYYFLSSSSCWVHPCVVSVEYNMDFTKLPTGVVGCLFASMSKLEAVGCNLHWWCHKLSSDWRFACCLM